VQRRGDIREEGERTTEGTEWQRRGCGDVVGRVERRRGRTAEKTQKWGRRKRKWRRQAGSNQNRQGGLE